MKIDKYIEIVRSDTPRLSSMGQKSCEMIQNVLGQHYTHVKTSTVSDIFDLQRLAAKSPDLIFLGMKNIPLINSGSELTAPKLWLSSYLGQRGINYTGSKGAAIALDYDKPAAKQVVREAGLPTSSYFTARAGQYAKASELPLTFPLFVKPPNGGGGKGIGADSVVRDFAGFTQKVQSIAEGFGTDALVEAYLPGREFSVAIIANIGSKELTAMPIELITEPNAQGDRILGQTVKAADTEHMVKVNNASLRKIVIRLAVDAFKALNARDYGRIDIRLNEKGQPYFIEANLIPGLAHHDFISYFTGACLLNQSMDYQTMILRIAELAFSRDISNKHGSQLYTATPSLLK